MFTNWVGLSRPGMAFADAGCQPVTPGGPAGAYIRPPAVSRQGRYEFSEKYDPKTNEQRVYIKRAKDERPDTVLQAWARHCAYLGSSGTLGAGQYYFATKACKVVIANLETHKNREIDLSATKRYERGAKPD
jgi:hypothetical protein